MKQSSKRFASMFIALVFIVIALFVFFDLIEPTYGDLQTKKGTELSTQAEITNEQAIVDQAKKLIAQYANASQDQENLARAMPSGPNAAGALADIYGLAQANTVNVRSVNLAPPVVRLQQPQGTATGSSTVQNVKPMGTLSIQITAIGSYENMKAYLAALETNIRVLDVTSFSMQPVAPLVTPAKGAPPISPDMFTYNLTITTYYQAI